MPDQPLVVIQRNKGGGEDKSLGRMMMMQQMMGAISGIGQSLKDYQSKTEEKKINAIEAVISGRMTPEQAKEVFGVAIPGGIEPGQEAIAKREIARLQAKAARGEPLSESESAQIGITKPAPSSGEMELGKEDVAARRHQTDVSAGLGYAQLADAPAERASRREIADIEAKSRETTETRRQEAEEKQRAFDKKQAFRAERLQRLDKRRETKWNLLNARETRKAEKDKLDIQFKAATYKTAVDVARQMDQDTTEAMVKLAQLSKDEKSDPEMRNLAASQFVAIVLESHPEMRPYLEEAAGKERWYYRNSFLRNVLNEYATIQQKKLKTPAGDSATFSTVPTPRTSMTPGAPGAPGATNTPAGGGVMTTDDLRRSLGK